MWYVILLFLTFSSRQGQGTQTRTERVKYGDGNRDKQLKWLIVSAVITDWRQVTHQINKYNKAPKKTDHWQELRASADSCAQSDEPIIRLPATAEKRPAVRMTARHLRRRSRGIIKHAAMLLVVIYATASSFWVVHRGRPRGCMLKQVRDWLIYTRAHISTGGINKRKWGAHIWQKQMCYLSLALEASGGNRTATRMCVGKTHTLAQLCFCKRFQLQTWNVLFYCFTVRCVHHSLHRARLCAAFSIISFWKNMDTKYLASYSIRYRLPTTIQVSHTDLRPSSELPK